MTTSDRTLTRLLEAVRRTLSGGFASFDPEEDEHIEIAATQASALMDQCARVLCGELDGPDPRDAALREAGAVLAEVDYVLRSRMPDLNPLPPHCADVTAALARIHHALAMIRAALGQGGAKSHDPRP